MDQKKMMKLSIEFSDGHNETIEVASWAIKDNCLQVQTKSEVSDSHFLVETVYYPLYNIIKFVPGGGFSENRYVK